MTVGRRLCNVAFRVFGGLYQVRRGFGATGILSLLVPKDSKLSS